MIQNVKSQKLLLLEKEHFNNWTIMLFKNQNEFIQKINIIHNFKYNYSNLIYKNTDSIIKIICHIHGEFSQRAHSHLIGSGCPKCNGSEAQKENAKLKWKEIALQNKMQCSHCLNIKPLIKFHKLLYINYNKWNSVCVECCKKRKIKNNSLMQRIKELLWNVKRRCHDKKLSYDLDSNFLKELWNKQNGLCFYTGLPMSLDHFGYDYNLDKISIDRVDSNLGYIKTNVVLTKWKINKIKNDLSILNFLQTISEIYLFNLKE